MEVVKKAPAEIRRRGRGEKGDEKGNSALGAARRTALAKGSDVGEGGVTQTTSLPPTQDGSLLVRQKPKRKGPKKKGPEAKPSARPQSFGASEGGRQLRSLTPLKIFFSPSHSDVSGSAVGRDKNYDVRERAPFSEKSN